MSPSHRTGTESSAFVISLKAVALVNGGGNAGIFRAIVAVDVIVELLAHCTFICSYFMFLPGHDCGTKCPVAAVSGYAIMAALPSSKQKDAGSTSVIVVVLFLHEVGLLSLW